MFLGNFIYLFLYSFYRHLDHLCTYVRWTVARDLICIESKIVKRGKDENSFFFFFNHYGDSHDLNRKMILRIII